MGSPSYTAASALAKRRCHARAQSSIRHHSPKSRRLCDAPHHKSPNQRCHRPSLCRASVMSRFVCAMPPALSPPPQSIDRSKTPPSCLVWVLVWVQATELVFAAQSCLHRSRLAMPNQSRCRFRHPHRGCVCGSPLHLSKYKSPPAAHWLLPSIRAAFAPSTQSKAPKTTPTLGPASHAQQSSAPYTSCLCHTP